MSLLAPDMLVLGVPRHRPENWTALAPNSVLRNAPIPVLCVLLVALGAIRDAPVVEGGRVVVGKVMRVGVTFDHRTIDGAHAAALARAVRAVMEDMKTDRTPKGLRVTETSSDPYVTRLIRSHAQVVSAFLTNGHPEMMRDHPLPAAASTTP